MRKTRADEEPGIRNYHAMGAHVPMDYELLFFAQRMGV